MLQLAPLPSPAGASTALWAWKVSAERLTFGGWTGSFISVTVWLITALSLFFLSYVWFNMFKTMMRSADIFFFFSCVVNWKAFSENFRNLYRVPYSLSRLWDYIQRLWWRLQRKRAKRCDAGVLWLWWLPRILRKRLSMRLEEAPNVSCNVFLMFELATFIAYFILLDSLFLLLH